MNFYRKCTIIFGHPVILNCLLCKLHSTLFNDIFQNYIHSGINIGSGCGPPELIVINLYSLNTFMNSLFYDLQFFILTQGPLRWEWGEGMGSH